MNAYISIEQGSVQRTSLLLCRDTQEARDHGDEVGAVRGVVPEARVGGAAERAAGPGSRGSIKHKYNLNKNLGMLNYIYAFAFNMLVLIYL